MARPQPATIIDDRGQVFPSFDWTTAPPGVKDDAQLAGIQARLQVLANPGFTGKMSRTSILSMLLMFAVQMGCMLLAGRFGAPMWVFYALIGLTSVWFVRQGIRIEFRKEAAALLLAHSRCASCGYPLDCAVVQPDDRSLCPECGAAWSLRRIGTHAVPEKLRTMAPSSRAASTVVGGRLMVLDATDRFVPIAEPRVIVRTAKPGTGLADCVRGIRIQLWWMVIVQLGGVVAVAVVFAVCVGKAGVWPLGWNLSTLWVVVMLTCGCIGAVRGVKTLGHAILGKSRWCGRVIVRRMIAGGYCPSCTRNLAATMPDRHGNLQCPGCGASWPKA